MKPLSEISTTRPSCKISFNICVDCKVIFTAKRKHKKRCNTCNDPATKQRKIKGLVRLERKCMNPDCDKPFITYNKDQFACCTSCSNIVTNIRRRYDIKLRGFLSICTNCGADAFTSSLCDRCQEKTMHRTILKRVKLKGNGLCRECGKVHVEDDQYYCRDCLEKMRARKAIRICISDGCENEALFSNQLCKDCFDRREAEKNSCKVYFVECCNCNLLFTSNRKGMKYCSNNCVMEVQMVKPKNRICIVCGKEYEFHRGINFDNTCSVFCRKEATRDIKRNAKHKRRLLIQNSFIESVKTITLFKRDQGRCQICGKKLNLTRQVPHPLAVTVDHIIPISKGGEHSYRNTQLACFRCNSIKGDRPVDGGEQLLLFG